MLKLVMVGEQHGIGGDSKNLPKIGPAIAKLRQGNGIVRLLVEGEFFSANEKAVYDERGKPKKPSEMLIPHLRMHFSRLHILDLQSGYTGKRGIGAIDGVSIAPIESFPLRQSFAEILQPIHFKKSALNLLFDLVSGRSESHPHAIQSAINALDKESAQLDSIIRNWAPSDKLHSLEIQTMEQLSAMMRGMRDLLAKGKELGISAASNPAYNQFIAQLDSFLPGIQAAFISHGFINASSEKPADKDGEGDFRSQIQSYYSYSWMSNGKSAEFDTLATITGRVHIPYILSNLQNRIGDKLWSFSPVVVLTDEDAQIEKALLKFGERLKILRLK